MVKEQDLTISYDMNANKRFYEDFKEFYLLYDKQLVYYPSSKNFKTQKDKDTFCTLVKEKKIIPSGREEFWDKDKRESIEK